MWKQVKYVMVLYMQSEDNFFHVGPGERPKVGRLCSKCPYLLNHLTGPLYLFYSILLRKAV